MRVAIAGAGNVGLFIANDLHAAGHEVQLIEQNPAVVERVLPSSWGGKKLASLNEPGRFLLTAVTRLGEAQIASPKLVGQEGDVLHLVVDVNAMDALRERLEHGPDA